MSKAKGAFATLLSSPTYVAGTLVLDYTLREVGSKYPLVVMVSSGVPKECLDVLAIRKIKTIPVERLTPKVEGSAILDERFSDTWCKLAAFNLVDYERVVLLDSDMIVRKSMDELIEMPLNDGWIAAVHVCACNPRRIDYYPADWIPENCAFSSIPYPPEIKEGCPRPYTLLNSGTVVLTPSTQTFREIEHHLATSPSVEKYRFPDQDLLAEFFYGKWKPLPYTFNALKTLRVIHEKLWRDEDIRCVHYILGDKPWKKRPNREEGKQGPHYEVNSWWWDAYFRLQREIERVRTEDNEKALGYVEQYVAA
ncbi:nucleotide-diphospho-sugar transferase [Fomitiporia mediterranea MF3/22]|uniref:nucleotide-diphospho-sugar transferase n=1 Tax=Fomitiporia mediterranea (strain MF3/22) TaxID=694068 RepID=UPI000440833E|nr:nucleotide-diphospho-sugar transferase [Fomitiporia mediterranea MF3/22]EJD03848.1 nucleotide-diphospho-sugar transferase [Fomitiporia mediterranea MF3/22]